MECCSHERHEQRLLLECHGTATRPRSLCGEVSTVGQGKQGFQLERRCTSFHYTARVLYITKVGVRSSNVGVAQQLAVEGGQLSSASVEHAPKLARVPLVEAGRYLWLTNKGKGTQGYPCGGNVQ